MSFLDFPGLQYFYNKYLKPIKPHAREETIKSYTVNEQGHVPDAQLVVQLKEENESLQEEIEKLNSALEYRIFNGEEGFTEKGLSFPASGVALLNKITNKIDIHCAGVLESLSESDESSDFINLNSLCSHIGINTLNWNPAHNSRVIVFGEVGYSSSYDGIWGRTGLRLQKTSDYGAAISRAYTSNLGSVSPWLLSVRTLYKQGNIYYIDIWGADYD